MRELANLHTKLDTTISNNHEGYEKLLSKLKEFKQQGTTPAVGTEGHDGYLSPLDEYLGDEGFDLVSLNPLRVKRYKDMLGQQKKTDNYDAYIIADFLKSKEDQLENLPRFKSRTQRLKKTIPDTNRLKEANQPLHKQVDLRSR